VYNAGRGANATFEIIKIVVDKVMEGGLQHATYWEVRVRVHVQCGVTLKLTRHRPT
jgi:hypothetical protein